MTVCVTLANPSENVLPNDSFSQEYKRWCKETFGPSFQHKLTKDRKWSDMRWWKQGRHFYFRNEADAVLFSLKWS